MVDAFFRRYGADMIHSISNDDEVEDITGDFPIIVVFFATSVLQYTKIIQEMYISACWLKIDQYSHIYPIKYYENL